jgi:hypothetical protein
MDTGRSVTWINMHPNPDLDSKYKRPQHNVALAKYKPQNAAA